MKKLFVIFSMVALFSMKSKAQTYATNNMATGIATVAAVPVVLTHLTLFTTNTTPTIVYLYDGYLTQTNAGYTNFVTYTTNQITLYTNTMGLTNTWTNTVIATVANGVAARSNVISPALATLVVPAYPGILDVNTYLMAGNRVTMSNTLQGTSAIITYRVR